MLENLGIIQAIALIKMLRVNAKELLRLGLQNVAKPILRKFVKLGDSIGNGLPWKYTEEIKLEVDVGKNSHSGLQIETFLSGLKNILDSAIENRDSIRWTLGAIEGFIIATSRTGLKVAPQGWQIVTIPNFQLETCHTCFGLFSPSEMVAVKLERLDETVEICSGCLFDIYALNWTYVESDK